MSAMSSGKAPDPRLEAGKRKVRAIAAWQRVVAIGGRQGGQGAPPQFMLLPAKASG